jgi:hypothetical protein
MFSGTSRLILARVSALRGGIKNFSTANALRGGHGHAKEQGWAYRNWDAPGPVGQKWQKFAFVCVTFTYWWILHGIFTEPEHIIGHGEYMDVTKLTDKQLGIPDDDE